VAWAADGVRGEVTIVVSGASPSAASSDPDDLRAAVAGLEGSGMSRKDAIAQAAREAGVPKRAVYDLVHRGEPGA
jgi:16S rRNA (cytidine1402-2'-O)-methyltransferase